MYGHHGGDEGVEGGECALICKKKSIDFSLVQSEP